MVPDPSSARARSPANVERGSNGATSRYRSTCLVRYSMSAGIGRRMGEVAVKSGVGGPDQSVIGPRDDVHHPPVVGAGQDHCAVAEADLIALDDQMGSLGYDHLQLGRSVDRRGREGAGSHHHRSGFDAELPARNNVAEIDGGAISHRITEVAWTRLTATAPRSSTAVLAMAMTKRASSVWASEYTNPDRRPADRRFGTAWRNSSTEIRRCLEPGRSKPPKRS